MDPQNPFSPVQDSSMNPHSWQGGNPNEMAPVSTTGITVIMVLFLIFGILGVLTGIFAIIGFFFQAFLQGMANPDKNPMVDRIQEIQAAFQIPSLILTSLNMVLSIILIAGAVGLATRKRWGWSVARIGCTLGLVFEVLRLLFTFAQQGYMAMKLSSLQAGDFGTDVPPQAQNVVIGAMIVGSIIGIVMAVAYVIGKMIMYYFSKRYLNKPEIERIFA